MKYTIAEIKEHAGLCATIEASMENHFDGKSGAMIDQLLSRLESLEKVNKSLVERMKDAHDISLDGEHSVARSVLLDAIGTSMQSQGKTND